MLRQEPEEPLQPVPLGAVYLASDADVAQALRMDAYLTGAQPTGIPVGLSRVAPPAGDPARLTANGSAGPSLPRFYLTT